MTIQPIRREKAKRYTEPLSFNITPEMREHLEVLVQEREVSLAHVARQMIAAGLKAQGEGTASSQ